MCVYIPTTKRCDAATLANLFVDAVICKYGVPQGIVSDRGTVFTSQYWSDFCYVSRVKRRLSTAFHPQTDGQTERQNQVLEQYLRCYCADKQGTWAAWLPLAEFAANNSDNAALRMSPFYAMYGYNPRLYAEARDGPREGEVQAVSDRVKRLQDNRAALAERMRAASDTQSKGYNARHKPQSFNVNDQVMLSTKNLRVRQASRKLSPKFIGPFRILEVIGT